MGYGDIGLYPPLSDLGGGFRYRSFQPLLAIMFTHHSFGTCFVVVPATSTYGVGS